MYAILGSSFQNYIYWPPRIALSEFQKRLFDMYPERANIGLRGRMQPLAGKVLDNMTTSPPGSLFESQTCGSDDVYDESCDDLI